MRRPFSLFKNRRFKLKSLQWQLIIRFLALFILMLGIMEISQYLIMKQYFYKSREQLLESRYHIVKTTVDSIKSDAAVYNLAKYLIENTVDRNISTAIIDKDGKIAAESSEAQSSPTSPHLSRSEYLRLLSQKGDLEGNTVVRGSSEDQIEIIWRKLGSDTQPYGLIQLSSSTRSIHDTLERQFFVYVVSSFLIVLIGGTLARSMLKYTLKPLHNMTDTVDQITIGRLDRRLPEDNGQAEVDDLSSAFNGMLERLEASFEKERELKEKLRRFVSDASHELRTPLTSIHGFVEVLLMGAAKNENQLNSSLNSILIESERLTKLVNDLLLITRLDRQAPVEMAEESLDNIIREIYPQLQIISGDRRLELQSKTDLWVLVNRNQIKQVIYNLVHNAILHTSPKDGVIILALSPEVVGNEAFAVLRVTDNGTGIPKKDIDKVFDRFFRSEAHRSRKQGGYGLGLSIVQAIIDAHKGRITVDSEMGKGTTFTIYFKLSRFNNE